MITFMFRMTYIMLEMMYFYVGNVCGLVTIWYFWVHFGDIIESFRVYFVTLSCSFHVLFVVIFLLFTSFLLTLTLFFFHS